jgi:hypothetical protein
VLPGGPQPGRLRKLRATERAPTSRRFSWLAPWRSPVSA